jgi:hypothetical protein
MGTRNLTVVIHKGETKVAQYGQWDGYPSGQGATILGFLRKMKIRKFKQQLNKCKFTDDEKQKEIDKFLEAIGSYEGWMNDTQAGVFNKRYPYFSRDHCGEILSLINDSQDDVIWLCDSTSFAGSFSCEWGYVVDLDKKTFEVYTLNRIPLTEEDRFFKTKEKGEKREPIKMVHSFDLKKLPNLKTFLEICDPSDDDDDDE